jgi:hypothetical protein
VSDSLPISSRPDSEEGSADDDDEPTDSQLENNADDDPYGQDDLQWDVATVREKIEAILERMAGDIGDFEKPIEIVEEIDYSIELLNQLKAKIPV